LRQGYYRPGLINNLSVLEFVISGRVGNIDTTFEVALPEALPAYAGNLMA